MPKASRAPYFAAPDSICPFSIVLKGSPGDRKRIMNITKLTPRSRNAAIISSLEISSAMGLTEESFMVVSYIVMRWYLARYHRISYENATDVECYYRCSEVGTNQSSANEKNLYG